MPNTISTLPARPDAAVLDTVPEAHNGGWTDAAWAWMTGPTATTALTTTTAAVLTGLTVYLLMRKPSNSDTKRHLMYVPLLLVNGAAVYGQVAFFYESVAPNQWPAIGKLALAIVIALAVESIAVYVGWHAHDALLNKAGTTAARLRRASYFIAGVVASINYAHFADFNDKTGNTLGVNAASAAFGLLSLLSPWLWGLHTRRMQHVQLRNEGVIDATGATFSSERVRSFPIRSAAARRWSIDNYVTDPKEAWEGYNADLRARWADTVDSPGWWMRTNPVARVKQLTAALDAWKTALTIALMYGAEQATAAHRALAGMRAQVAELTNRITALTDERDTLTAALADLTAKATQTDGNLTAALTANTELTNRLTAVTGELDAATAEWDRTGKALEARIADLETELVDQHARLTGERVDALRKAAAEHASKLAIARAESRVPNLNDRRSKANRVTEPVTSGKAELTDESAVQMMLTAHSDPTHEWSKNAVRTLTGVGLGRAPRLIDMWLIAATEQATGNAEAVNQ